MQCRRAIERHCLEQTDRSGFLHGLDPRGVLFESHRDACFDVGGSQEARADDSKSYVSGSEPHEPVVSASADQKGYME